MRTLLFLILIVPFQELISQPPDSSKVSISHIFFCIDSLSYANLLKHEFIANVFARTYEASNKTTTDSWTGKYIMGRQSYIEVFSASFYKGTKPQLGDKFGDVAIVFRTRKPGDMEKLKEQMKTDNRDPRYKLMEYEKDGKTIAYNQNLYLAQDSLEDQFRPYVEELTPEFLKQFGFTETEIQLGITEQQFREKRSGRQYDKLFDNIKKIELTLTPDEFAYLAETLKYLGFSKTENGFTNNKLEIICSVQRSPKYKLKAIFFTLLHDADNITIEISKNLLFSAGGRNASFQFNYQ